MFDADDTHTKCSCEFSIACHQASIGERGYCLAMTRRSRCLAGILVVVGLCAGACTDSGTESSGQSDNSDTSGQSKESQSDGSAADSPGFADRAVQYVKTAAAVELGETDSRAKVWRAVAQLSLDPDTAVDLVPSDFAVIDQRFATYADTTDFDMIALINLWYRSGLGEQLSAETRDHVKGLILGFKYWYTDPQPEGTIDERWYWSENHQILFHTIEYLAGQAFPEETFTAANLTGSEHMARAEPLITRWIKQRTQWGFSEWYSHVYYQEDLEAVVALAEFAENGDVATRGAIASDLVLYDMASHTFDGAFGATHGRTYKKDKMTALDEDTWDVSKLVLNDTDLPYQSDLGAVFLATTTKYVPPAVLGGIVTDRGAEPSKTDVGGVVERARHSLELDPLAEVTPDPVGPHGLAFDDPDNLMVWWAMAALTPWQTVVETTSEMTTYNLWASELFADFKPFEPIVKASSPDSIRGLARSLAPQLNLGLLSEANTYTWRSAGSMLSTVQDFRKGQASQQHHVWQATFSPDAQVFTTHPRTPTEPGVPWHSNTEDWTGNASLPRSAQYRNVNVSIYAPLFQSKDVLQGSYMEYTHAYLPQERFDEVVRAGNWTFARLGSEYLALYSWRAPEWVTYDPATYDTNGLVKPFELVASGGPNNVWITELGTEAMHGSFADFQTAILASPPVVRPLGDPEENTTAFDVSWTSPSNGPIEFGWDQPFVVDGADQPLDDYPRIDSPWAQVAFDSTSYDIKAGEHTLKLDVTAPSRKSSGDA